MSNPFTVPDLVAYALRIATGPSADPLCHLEQWELSGAVNGTLRSVALAIAHPAPHGPGVWRWVVDHRAGRYASAGGDAVVREEQSSIAWNHADLDHRIAPGVAGWLRADRGIDPVDGASTISVARVSGRSP